MYHGDALGHMELSPPLKTAFSGALAWQRGSKWPLESSRVVDNLHLLLSVLALQICELGDAYKVRVI